VDFHVSTYFRNETDRKNNWACEKANSKMNVKGLRAYVRVCSPAKNVKPQYRVSVKN